MMQSEKFQCLECDYQATWTRNLAEHQNSEHKEEKFQCYMSVIIKQLGKIILLAIMSLFTNVSESSF